MTHSFFVKAELEGSELPAGITVTVTLSGDTASVVTIPASAIYSSGGMQLVTIVDTNGAARNKAVTTGLSYGESVEVRSGISAGEIVVINRSGVIAEGTRIEQVNG
jgi:multidrug efflux pump subunit AcrA (membrane-fusion protein)